MPFLLQPWHLPPVTTIIASSVGQKLSWWCNKSPILEYATICHKNIDYSSHDYTDWVQNPEKGEQTKECETCGKIVTEVYHDLQEIPAKEATCIEDGNIKYYMCKVHENEFFSDSSMTTKLTQSDIVITKLGHDISSEYHIDEEKHSTFCTRCNTDLVSEDHKWDCYTDDLNPEFHTSTCTVCGRMDFVKAFGSNEQFHWEKCGANDDWRSEKENVHHYVNNKCVICGREE